MDHDDDKTLGQRIDEVLAPFLKDKADLQARLERDLAQRQRIDVQIQATKRDLQIVEQTMAQALRDAAKKDPVLAAAFGVQEVSEAPRTDGPAPMPHAAPAPGALGRPVRSHPLLNPTA